MSRKITTQKTLRAQYREAARDAAREREARAWTEGLIMTADKQRLKKRIGKISPSEMLGIERAIKIQLGIH
jgi:mRNA-degrading endonuclease toxin of MazEF toxin-antitoxin module